MKTTNHRAAGGADGPCLPRPSRERITWTIEALEPARAATVATRP